MRKPILFGYFLLILFFCTTCARNPVTGQRELSLISTEQEIAMGQQADPEIVAHFGLYDDPELQRLIDEKGQQIADISHRSELDYTFRIIDSPVVNAFAVPGGYVYFTRGIMAYFNNEAEFVGVLGHEIGHITARHSVSQQSKATLAQLGLMIGMVVSPEFAQFGDLASQSMGLLFLKFGRDDERQSDELGVEYATRIGYDAQEMADFFATLERTAAQEGATPIPNFLSTHPSPGERRETVSALAAQWKDKVGKRSYDVGRDSYLQLIDGMIYGEDPKQGFFENGYFYHPELKFQFVVPQQWATQNSPQAVQMADPDGKAMMIFTLAPGENLQQAGEQILQKYQLQLVESGQKQVNGMPALVMVADQVQQGQSQQAQTIRTLTYLIEYEGTIYSMMGVSHAQTFNTYAPGFQQVSESFNRLTDQEKLNRQPERLQIKRVDRTASLGELLRSYRMPQDRMEEIAILNGMQLNDQVAQGTQIKILSGGKL